MQHNKYGYVSSTETKIFSDLEKWLKKEKAKKISNLRRKKNMRRRDDIKEV